MRKTAICCLLLLTLPFMGRVFAQDGPKTPEASAIPETAQTPASPVRYYHLDFAVRELGEDGKPVNSRSYFATVSTGRNTSSTNIRAGSKIPIATGAYMAGNQQPNLQFQYQDVGVNIDIGPDRTEEIGSRLALFLTMEISSLASSAHLGGPNGVEQPVIRQNRWRGPVLIPIGKPTTVFSSEYTDSKGSMQVVVTATPL